MIGSFSAQNSRISGQLNLFAYSGREDIRSSHQSPGVHMLPPARLSEKNRGKVSAMLHFTMFALSHSGKPGESSTRSQFQVGEKYTQMADGQVLLRPCMVRIPRSIQLLIERNTIRLLHWLTTRGRCRRHSIYLLGARNLDTYYLSFVISVLRRKLDMPCSLSTNKRVCLRWSTERHCR